MEKEERQDVELEEETDTEEESADESSDPLDGIDDIEELRRVAKAERAKRQRLGKRKETPKEAPSQPNITNNPTDDERWERLELKTDGYNAREVDYIMRNGGRSALEDAYVKAGIEAIREQAQAEAAADVDSSTKSTVERKYTQDQLRNMSAEELTKILPKAN